MFKIRHRHNKIILAFFAFIFLLSQVLPYSAYAQYQGPVLNLPIPGSIVTPSAEFTPVVMKGLTIFPDNPLRFDFMVYTGDSTLKGNDLKDESERIIKYFLAALTMPEDEMWVNLSPYEKDRIIPDTFGLTEMGRDLLAQDYVLKQLTASLVNPEDDLGKEFWDKIYKKAYELYGTSDVPVNTFNKVWILPDKAVVYEKGQMAFLVDSRLKIMLDEDYVSLKENVQNKKIGSEPIKNDDVKKISSVSSQIVREILLPAIEKEVNEGKNFTLLRQIYASTILATWFKQNLKESFLGKVYAEKSKIQGVNVDDKEIKEKIYQQYLEAFKKGVYNYIKEDYDPATQQVIPRKYFSGGTEMGRSTREALRTIKGDNASLSERAEITEAIGRFNPEGFLSMETNLAPRDNDGNVLVGKNGQDDLDLATLSAQDNIKAAIYEHNARIILEEVAGLRKGNKAKVRQDSRGRTIESFMMIVDITEDTKRKLVDILRTGRVEDIPDVIVGIISVDDFKNSAYANPVAQGEAVAAQIDVVLTSGEGSDELAAALGREEPALKYQLGQANFGTKARGFLALVHDSIERATILAAEQRRRVSESVKSPVPQVGGSPFTEAMETETTRRGGGLEDAELTLVSPVDLDPLGEATPADEETTTGRTSRPQGVVSYALPSIFERGTALNNVPSLSAEETLDTMLVVRPSGILGADEEATGTRVTKVDVLGPDQEETPIAAIVKALEQKIGIQVSERHQRTGVVRVSTKIIKLLQAPKPSQPPSWAEKCIMSIPPGTTITLSQQGSFVVIGTGEDNYYLVEIVRGEGEVKEVFVYPYLRNGNGQMQPMQEGWQLTPQNNTVIIGGQRTQNRAALVLGDPKNGESLLTIENNLESQDVQIIRYVTFREDEVNLLLKRGDAFLAQENIKANIHPVSAYLRPHADGRIELVNVDFEDGQFPAKRPEDIPVIIQVIKNKNGSPEYKFTGFGRDASSAQKSRLHQIRTIMNALMDEATQRHQNIYEDAKEIAKLKAESIGADSRQPGYRPMELGIYLEWIGTLHFDLWIAEEIKEDGHMYLFNPNSLGLAGRVMTEQERNNVRDEIDFRLRLADKIRRETDAAELANEPAKAVTPGGIDLNSNRLNLETKGEGVKFNLPKELENLDPASLSGFTPVIFRIVPITNLPFLLGLSEKDQQQPANPG